MPLSTLTTQNVHTACHACRVFKVRCNKVDAVLAERRRKAIKNTAGIKTAPLTPPSPPHLPPILVMEKVGTPAATPPQPLAFIVRGACVGVRQRVVRALDRDERVVGAPLRRHGARRRRGGGGGVDMNDDNVIEGLII